MKREFSFDLINKEIPYEVIKKKIDQISFLTQGYVTCEISEYIGKIRSYEELTTLGLIGSSNFKLNNPVRHVDIQEELGEEDEDQREITRYKNKINKAKLPKPAKEKALYELNELILRKKLFFFLKIKNGRRLKNEFKFKFCKRLYRFR